MAFEKLTEDLNIIQKLDDEPNDVGGLSSDELKAEFDRSGLTIQTFINSLVDALNAVTAAASVGFTAITGVDATDVQGAIARLQQNIVESQQGAVADGSITTQKLADLAVTTAKLSELAVTTANLADLAVTTAKIANGAVTAGKLGAGSVTEAKIGTAAVTEDKISAGAVTAAKIGASAVTSQKIEKGAVSYVVTTSIPASSFVGDHTAVIPVIGVSANDSVIMDVNPSISYALAEKQIEAWGKVYKATVGDSEITFELSDGHDVEIPIKLLCVRK